MIIIAREGFNAYGPNKLAMFAGEIADVEENFARQLIAEGKAYEYSYTDGAVIPEDLKFCATLAVPNADPQFITLSENAVIDIPSSGQLSVVAIPKSTEINSDFDPQESTIYGIDYENSEGTKAFDNSILVISTSAVGNPPLIVVSNANNTSEDKSAFIRFISEGNKLGITVNCKGA